MNWYNIASVYQLIANDIGQNLAGFGLISASFLAGIGLFQLPGGLLAARAGPKRTAILGTVTASASAAACGYANSIELLVLLRFIVGVGMALVFAPGVTLITREFRHGSEGLSVGLFNSAFTLGGAVGLLSWAVVGELIGRRLSLVLGGGLGLLTAMLMAIAVPQDTVRSHLQVGLSDLRRLLSHRWLILIGVELLGLAIGYQLVSNFVVLELQYQYRITGALPGIVGG